MAFRIFDNLNDEKELIFSPLEVKVKNGNAEDAFKRFRVLVQTEGILKQLKTRSAYETPRAKRKRKDIEAYNAPPKFHRAVIIDGSYAKKQERKQAKRAKKMEERKRLQEESSGVEELSWLK